MLGRTFDFVGALQGAKKGLWIEELLQAAAQQWPVVLSHGEVSPQVEHGDLAYLARNALTTHESVGEVALSGGFVVGAGLSNEHACHASRKNMKIENQSNILWHNKMQIKTRSQENLYKSMCCVFDSWSKSWLLSFLMLNPG